MCFDFHIFSLFFLFSITILSYTFISQLQTSNDDVTN